MKAKVFYRIASLSARILLHFNQITLDLTRYIVPARVAYHAEENRIQRNPPFNKHPQLRIQTLNAPICSGFVLGYKLFRRSHAGSFQGP